MGRILLPRIFVRPLLPPEPIMTARIQPQHMHWQVGRYRERLRSGPGGLGRGQVWVAEREGEQHNLILNQFYDALIPSYGLLGPSQYAVVGTGSTDPSPTQTGLASEVARSNAVPSGESNQAIYISPGVYDIKRVYEFTEAQVGGRNLTEWGFAPVATAGGNLMVRELFRDANGTPVVLSLASDQRLRLIYKYRVTLGPTTPQPVTVNINGVGPRTAQFIVTGRFASGSGGALNLYGVLFVPNQYYGDLVVADYASRGAGGQGGVVLLNSAVPLTYLHSASLGSVGADPTYDPPVGRSRRWGRLYAPGEANMTIVSVVLGTFAYNAPNYWGPTVNLVFDSGQEVTKTNLYKLFVGYWTLTWGP